MRKRNRLLYSIILMLVLFGIIKNFGLSTAYAADNHMNLDNIDNADSGTEVYTDSKNVYKYTNNSDGTLKILGFTQKYEDEYDHYSNTKFVIPSVLDGKKVTSIGSGAFYNFWFGENCIVEISEGISTVEAQAFYGAAMKKVLIPSTVKAFDIWDYTFSYLDAEEIKVSSNNPYIADIDGILCTKDKKTIYACPTKYNKQKIVLPSETETLACASFGNTGVRELVFPNPNAWFYTYTFFGCNITVYAVESRVNYWKEQKQKNNWPEGNVSYKVLTSEMSACATKGHSWDTGKITKQPTTSETGIITFTCSRCGTTKTETVAKLPEEKKLGVVYTTHIQSIGWQSQRKNGDLAGTVGDSKRLEAIKINLENAPYSGDIEYRTHVQTYGWQGWVKNGALSGTSGQAKRLEAIQIRLTGSMAEHFDVYYRIQVQTFGWLAWAKNGEYAGSAGYAKRLEAIQIVLVEKGKTLDRKTLNKAAKITDSTKVTESTSYVAKAPSVEYQTHIQSIGWQSIRINGDMAGTSGQAKRLEGIKINLSKPPYEGGIRYKTHVQTYGWQDWRYDGDMSGTRGEAKRLEAICIELTGEMAKQYDVYYRVHAQTYGWLGWACNGEEAGTSGFAKRLEGIQIVLVEKGQAAPGKTYKGITANRNEAYISK